MSCKYPPGELTQFLVFWPASAEEAPPDCGHVSSAAAMLRTPCTRRTLQCDTPRAIWRPGQPSRLSDKPGSKSPWLSPPAEVLGRTARMSYPRRHGLHGTRSIQRASLSD